MSGKKIGYVAAVVVGIALVAYLRHARYNDVRVPWWVWALAALIATGLIAHNVVVGRRRVADQKSIARESEQ